MANRKGVFIGAYVPNHLKESLRRRAAAEHRTLSQEITRILEEAVHGRGLPPGSLDRRTKDSQPRRRASDPMPRRRANDVPYGVAKLFEHRPEASEVLKRDVAYGECVFWFIHCLPAIFSSKYLPQCGRWPSMSVKPYSAANCPDVTERWFHRARFGPLASATTARPT